MSDTASPAIQRAGERRETRKRFKGGGNQTYTKLLHYVFQGEQYAKLSPRAVKLLVDLMAQYRGVNNGDLTTAWSVMSKAGWRSKDALYKAQAELEERGWLVRMRQGMLERGKHTATLWALSFFGINDCGKEKRDAGAPKHDTMPLHRWRDCNATPKTSGRGFKQKVLVRVPGSVWPGYRTEAWPFPPPLVRVPDRKAA